MAIQWSTAVRHARLAAIESAVGTAARLILYSGTAPANTAAAVTANTDIITFVLASDWAETPGTTSAGTVKLNNLPLQGNATRAGTIGYYRIWDSAVTTCHEQGTVTATGGGGDMTVDNPTVTNTQAINITAFTKTEAGA